jgi:exodeoxyribonuclease V alpha subunit
MRYPPTNKFIMNMNIHSDVHRQFAAFFEELGLQPFAYLVSKRLQEGHICIENNEVDIENDEIPKDLSQFVTNPLNYQEWVSTSLNTIKPFVVHKNRMYLQRYFKYETNILQSIGRILKSESTVLEKRMQDLISNKANLDGLMADYDLHQLPNQEKIDWQLVGAIQGFLNNLTIITGGPGTGKTTTVAKILTILFQINPDCSVALAAPTGKAAVRMAESLKHTNLKISDTIREKFNNFSPSTIHRLLQPIPNSIYFKHNAENPLPYDVLIVDEASMIDVAIFSKFLDAIAIGTRVILLGDKNQLASVEAGSLLGDFCKSLGTINQFDSSKASFINQFILDDARKIGNDNIVDANHPLSGHIIELMKSHRFTSDGGIGKLSTAIINNNQDALINWINASQMPPVQIDTNGSSSLFEEFIVGYEAYIKERDTAKAIKNLNSLRVLCAIRESDVGVYAVNKKIETLLQQKKLINTGDDFYENRPIIVTKNYAEFNLFNGDVGIIRTDENGVKKVWFENPDHSIRGVLPTYIASLETVFAMTIHKSQGSEYDKILVVLPQNIDNKLLTRELLYTAVTRAKKELIVQAPEEIILKTTSQSVKRASGIMYRFDEI